MIDKTLLKYIEKHRNGYIILDNKRNVIYENLVARDIFSREINKFFENIDNCNNTILEKKDVKDMNKYNICLLNKALNEVIEDREKSIVENLEFNIKSDKFNISFEATKIDEYIVIEFIKIAKQEDEAYLLSTICNKSNDLLFYKDSNLIYRYANDAYAKFLGVDKSSIIGKSDEDLLPKEMLKECLRTDMIAMADETYQGVELVGDKCFRVLKDKIDDGIMCLAKDITDEFKLCELANRDDLTKLPNRRKFNADIEAIYEENNDDYYLMLIDIDDFSNVNNTHGHDVGDKFLKALSDTIRKYRKISFYRLGGDEFIGLTNIDINNLENILKNIVKELKIENKISISVGVKKLDLSVSYDINYKLLDETLYLSKKNGKNQVSYFSI